MLETAYIKAAEDGDNDKLYNCLEKGVSIDVADTRVFAFIFIHQS